MYRKIIILALLFAPSAHAADEDDMRSVLEANFDACNREDVDALMETCSRDMPDRPGFRKESEKLFREKDIYYRIVRFQVISIRDDYATAVVVQVSHTADRKSSDESDEAFRNGTTLLTKDECVRYNVAFKRDDGEWKCLATISEPVPCKEND